MALRIIYKTECDCGGEMVSVTHDLTQSGEDGTVTIDLDMLGDMTLICNKCDDQAFLPNVGDTIIDGDDL
ncbi:hypothetical protein FDH86_gp044 [Arthrobacter phage Tank]|uniref:Uncharacterized protein n=2 Tax=Tankvirus tank TaxID=1982567 RepID=A0A0U4KBB8_9CAUD|nr:hypothetical protein FDH86_gp044 [Arthrobacter phage Tank]ALY10579.1 hypothetical protein TANK_44 [Arthrobacter phage Tank]ALY10828.1 hypothetical protein WILDE_44 [Arthrobacter phage Wilde]